ncbi:helix-turn-helix transcriptional regulator [Duganella callida]|uniref:Helix-turn-helix transcriptional regulator n=1 Tax=Duganella callida TaxID=2561932 RepID=A0A4Y9SUB9_9BURK|nr:helix-turn-helix transcriptional regulator [Duganella callida]TFW29077.1 helix-turn-helix transcriptional regulator [Duganella callida]
MTLARINQLLTHMYESVMAPNGFHPFVTAFIDLFQLKAAMLLTVHVHTREVKGLWMEGLGEKWMASYALEYGAEDMLAQHIHRAPVAAFYASNLDLDPDSALASRFYREWVQPQGVACASGAIVLREGPWLTQMMLQRSPVQPPFSREELDMFNLLMPHLQRAIQMRQRFAELQLGQNPLTGSLDALALPAILVDEFCRVAHCNQAAAAQLRHGRDLWQDQGHLFGRNGAITRQLNLEIAKAIHASRGTARELPGVVLVPRPGQRDLMVLISPLRMRAGAEACSGALLFLFDPEATPALRAELVQRLFGLSDAEAELAVAICSGQTLEEASNRRGTTISTARSQLRSIFGKTGTNRQADLVSMLLASPAYFLSHHDRC